MSFEPRRLDDMPEEGRIMMGNPAQETAVARQAAELLTDYVLSPIVPRGQAYVVNLDQIMAPPVLDWTWTD